MLVTAQVAVVGAGPAGLAAAAAAARAGASVTLLEEHPQPGGQLLYRVQPVESEPGGSAGRPERLRQRLVDAALAAGVAIRTSALVAGCFAGNALLVVRDGRGTRLIPDAVVVATGSTDLPYPFAGATFPGVFSARGLQILMHQHWVRPGRRFAVIGGGTDAEELVADIMLAGGEVVWSGIAPAPLLRAEGAAGVRAIVVGQERHEVDIVAIAVGRQADAALAVMAGVPLVFSPELGGPVPIVDEQMRTQVSGLFVAGDAAGAGSVLAAIGEGRLAGVAAAVSQGLAPEDQIAASREMGGPELAWRMAARESSATSVPTSRE